MTNSSGRSEAYVNLRNISRAGAFFITDEALPIGDSVAVKLGDGLAATGTVVRARPLFGDRFAIGVRFEGLRAKEEDNDGSDFRGEIYQLELKECNREAFGYYQRLERVRDFVIANLDESITLAQAAEVAAMERTYFSSFFHEKVGVTFREWLQYLRISRALEMISEKDYSITEVAFAVGFEELSTFQKAFKRWTSLTPRDFKRLARPA